MKRLSRTGALLAALLLVVGGCAQPVDGTTSGAELTPAIPTPVTLTMFGFWSDKEQDTARQLQAALAERFPHIALEYEAFPTGAAPYSDELERRIAHQQEADLFMTANTALASSGALLDLTREEMVGRYSLAMMRRLSDDGLVSLLPGPGAIQSYLVNTELMPEPPQTLAQLEQACLDAQGGGARPFFVPYEQTQPLLIKALAAGYLASPEGQLWLERYRQGEGTMRGNPAMEAVWALAERMMEQQLVSAEDMVFAESRRTAMMTQNVAAMTTFSTALTDYLRVDGEVSDRFVLIPFVGETPDQRTVFSAPTCYFAASARLSQPVNEAKRAAALQVLDFISTEEGQRIVCGNSALPISYLSTVPLPSDRRIDAVSEIVMQDSHIAPPDFGRGVDQTVGEALGAMLRGEMTAQQAIAACDAQSAAYQPDQSAPAPAQTLGEAQAEFPWTFRTSRTQELAITSFVVDSLRAAAKTDMAIELGTAVRGEFFAGPITDRDVNSAVRVDKTLHRVEMTGQQLWDIIEQGVQADNSSWFIVVSGLRYRYRPAAPDRPGVLLELTDAAGQAIDPAQRYTVAVSENQLIQVADVLNLYGTPAEDVGVTLRQAVTEQIALQSPLTPQLDGRIEVVQD